jgi:hypothetical protein
VADALYDALTVFKRNDDPNSSTPFKFASDYLTEIGKSQTAGGEWVSNGELEIALVKDNEDNYIKVNLLPVKDEFVLNFFGSGYVIKDDLTTTDKDESRIPQGTKEAWRYEFRAFVEIGKTVWGIYDTMQGAQGDVNFEDLIGEGSILWDLIGDQLADEMARVIESQINNISPDINIDFGENSGEVIRALAPILTDVIQTITDGGSILDIADALIPQTEGEEGETVYDYSNIVAIADSGASVQLGDDAYNSTMSSIADVLGGTVEFDGTADPPILTGVPDFSADDLAKWGVSSNAELIEKINGMIKPMSAQ